MTEIWAYRVPPKEENELLAQLNLNPELWFCWATTQTPEDIRVSAWWGRHGFGSGAGVPPFDLGMYEYGIFKWN